MTHELFREDGYLRECQATVTAVREHAVVLDQTVFYPTGGGQPGDTGTLLHGGAPLAITDCRRDRDSGEHLHICDGDAPLPAAGDTVTVRVDWERRHRLMRMHSCMHMLCAVIPAPVTGGQISDGRGRLDFDLPEAPDKEAISAELNRLIEGNHPMTMRWITSAELRQNPDLVRTISVQPPTDDDRVRLVDFHGVDLQPCGGTHVAASGEIGRVRVAKIEKKGKHNRRIIVVFDE